MFLQTKNSPSTECIYRVALKSRVWLGNDIFVDEESDKFRGIGEILGKLSANF